MSCQDVCVDMDYDGYSEFSRMVTRRAAKPYRCVECRRAISVGELHEYVTGKCEGSFYNERTCAECAEIREAFCCGGWVLGELWESIRDQLFHGWDEMKEIDCLAKLTTEAAIAKMRAEYAQYVEDRNA